MTRRGWQLAGLGLALLLGGCGVGHAIGSYFSPVATMTTDRFKALALERSLALDYVAFKAQVTERCARRLPTAPAELAGAGSEVQRYVAALVRQLPVMDAALCAQARRIAQDFEVANAAILAQLYDPSTAAFDLAKVIDLAKAIAGVAGAVGLQLGPALAL